MALSQRLALHTSRAGRKARSTRVLEALVDDAAASAATSVQPDQAEYLSLFDSWRSRRQQRLTTNSKEAQ